MPETPPGLVAYSGQVDLKVQAGINQVFSIIGNAVEPLLFDARNLHDLAHRLSTQWPVTYREATMLSNSLEDAVGIPAKYFLGNTPVSIVDWPRLRFTQRAWARAHTGELMSGLSEQTQRTLGNSLARSLGENQPIEVIAHRLRRYIGLDDRYATAVDNYRKGLEARGTKPSTVNRLARSYAARLRTARARTIAQTETTRALWEGQRIYWDQLIDEGAIQADRMRKRWRTHRDERVCPVCRPLHNKTVPWNEKFFSLELGTYFIGPPGHPNCRCEVTVLWSRYRMSKNDRRAELLRRALVKS